MVFVVKNLPANAGDVRNSGWIPESGISLEEGRETHFSVLAWKIPWTETPSKLHYIGWQRVRHY